MSTPNHIHGRVLFDRAGRYIGHQGANGLWCSEDEPERCPKCAPIADKLRAAGRIPSALLPIAEMQTSADVASAARHTERCQTGVRDDQTLTREMRYPAGRALSQYERDRLAGEARRAAAVPYEYEEPQEAAHRPTPGWTWVGIAIALAAFGGAVWAGVAGYRALSRMGWLP